jgi:hypothetical protein
MLIQVYPAVAASFNSLLLPGCGTTDVFPALRGRSLQKTCSLSNDVVGVDCDLQGWSLLGSFHNPNGLHRHLTHVGLRDPHSFQVKFVDLGKLTSTEVFEVARRIVKHV